MACVNRAKRPVCRRGGSILKVFSAIKGFKQANLRGRYAGVGTQNRFEAASLCEVGCVETETKIALGAPRPPRLFPRCR